LIRLSIFHELYIKYYFAGFIHLKMSNIVKDSAAQTATHQDLKSLYCGVGELRGLSNFDFFSQV